MLLMLVNWLPLLGWQWILGDDVKSQPTLVPPSGSVLLTSGSQCQAFFWGYHLFSLGS